MLIPLSHEQATDAHPACAQEVVDKLNSKLRKAKFPTVDAGDIAWVYDVSQAIARDTTSFVAVVFLRGTIGRRSVDVFMGQYIKDTLPAIVEAHLEHTPCPLSTRPT